MEGKAREESQNVKNKRINSSSSYCAGLYLGKNSHITMYNIWAKMVGSIQNENETSCNASVFDRMVAQPKVIHNHMECVITDGGRIPLEVSLNLIKHIVQISCQFHQIKFIIQYCSKKK